MQEIKFASECLDEDQKNYHTWAHRQALVKEFNLWESELEYTTSMLTKDVRNNSAWNQRLFVLGKGPWYIFLSATPFSLQIPLQTVISHEKS